MRLYCLSAAVIEDVQIRYAPAEYDGMWIQNIDNCCYGSSKSV